MHKILSTIVSRRGLLFAGLALLVLAAGGYALVHSRAIDPGRIVSQQALNLPALDPPALLGFPEKSHSNTGLFHQEDVEGDYPSRLEKETAQKVTVRFVRQLRERLADIDPLPEGDYRSQIKKPVKPLPGRTSQTPLEDAQGEDYRAWIKCSLRSSSIDITPATVDTPQWRPLGRELTFTWEWTIRADSPDPSQEIAAEIDIEWRPIGPKGEVIKHRLWEQRLSVVVDDPMLKTRQLSAVSPILGGSGAILTLIGVIPVRRRREEEETLEIVKSYEPEPWVGVPNPIEGSFPTMQPSPKSAPPVEIAPAVSSVRAGQPDNPANRENDLVECSVFAPPAAPQGETIMVQAFAHLSEQQDKARKLAEEFDSTALRRAVKTLSSRIARGTELMFHLAMSRVTVSDPVQTLIWNGHPESVQFPVEVPPDCPTGNVAGKLTVSQNSVPIGQISFLLKIVPAGESIPSALPEPAGEAARDYRYAFISYASKDRDKVLARVQMLDQMGIEYFQDLLSLDPGDRWEKELYKNIDRCDLFLLFWSTASKESPWVMKEVDYAMRRKGGDDEAPPEIKPVIIEGPPLVPPPDNLKHLHFNDKLIYFFSK